MLDQVGQSATRSLVERTGAMLASGVMGFDDVIVRAVSVAGDRDIRPAFIRTRAHRQSLDGSGAYWSM